MLFKDISYLELWQPFSSVERSHLCNSSGYYKGQFFEIILNLDQWLRTVILFGFGKLPFPTHLGKYFIKIGKIRAKIHEIGKIKAIFGLGMTPIYGLKNGQIKSLKEEMPFKDIS